MKRGSLILLFVFSLCSIVTSAQKGTVDAKKFFTDESPIDVTLATDFKKLFAEKKSEALVPATITMRFPDSSVVTEDININTRGISRKEICKMPPIMLNFKNPGSPKLSPLKKLKLVSACGGSNDEAQLLLKEALCYKIYNLITDMSFRVRMIHITYQDTKGKVKSYTQPGFIIEDMGALAKRNKCKEVKNGLFKTENTDRQQVTLVAIFEYMIGNLDWSTWKYHNIKLMSPVKDSTAPPYPVAFDFDYSGLVNAPYAVPPEEIPEVTAVTQRNYRGYPRTIEELQNILSIFKKKKDAIINLVTNFEGLTKGTKKEVLDFLDDFFKTIEKDSQIKRTFIENARTN
jgi:hypothetical protein